MKSKYESNNNRHKQSYHTKRHKCINNSKNILIIDNNKSYHTTKGYGGSHVTSFNDQQ